MPRIRLEVREKVLERRRSIREKIREWVREQYEEFRRRYTLEAWREIRRNLERKIETLRVLADLARGRGVVLFKVIHLDIPKGYAEMVIDDKMLMSQPEEIRNLLPTIFQEIARARGITRALMEKYPYLIPLLMRYIARFRKYPCKHDAFAIKVTPVTVQYFKGLKVTYYVLRYAKVSGVRADPYVGRSKPVDIYFQFIGRKKPANDLLNSMMGAGEGYSDPNDYVTIYVNTVRNRTIKLRLRFLYEHPHWVKYYFAKESGREEMYNYFGHCSVYLMQWEYSKSWELRKTEDRRLIGRRPRRPRLRDLLYYYGLRA